MGTAMEYTCIQGKHVYFSILNSYYKILYVEKLKFHEIMTTLIIICLVKGKMKPILRLQNWDYDSEIESHACVQFEYMFMPVLSFGNEWFLVGTV